MKIIYKDAGITSEVKIISKELNAEIEKLNSEEIAGKADFGEMSTGIGTGAIPKEVIDFGQYLITFFLDCLVKGIAFDLIKKVIIENFPKIKNKAKNSYKYFAISDGKDQRYLQTNDYFFFSTNLSEEELIKALDKTQETIEIIVNLKKKNPSIGSLRFDYSSISNSFILKEPIGQENLIPEVENRCSLRNLSACDEEGLMKLIANLLSKSNKENSKTTSIRIKILEYFKNINWEKVSQIATVISFFVILITVYIGIVQIRIIEKQLDEANEIASLQNVLTLDNQLYAPQSTEIIADIGDSKPILKEHGGKFSSYELDNFLSIFDSMNQVYIQRHISTADLCEQFDYYIQTSYEYPEIQSYLKKIRNTDGSYFVNFDDLYNNLIKRGVCKNY